MAKLKIKLSIPCLAEQLIKQEKLLQELIMKVNELAPALNALRDQLAKASGEINAQLEVLRNADLPQEAVDAVAAIASVTQALDDLNPDPVVVEE